MRRLCVDQANAFIPGRKNELDLRGNRLSAG